MKGKTLLLVLVCLFLVSAAKSQTGIIVGEDKSHIVFSEKTIDVSLVVRNNSASFDAAISVQILDDKNAIRSQTSQPHQIKKGERVYKISLPTGSFVAEAAGNLAWYRLRYRIGNIEETISLSEILKNDFELRVAAAEKMFSGQIYRARIRAVDPFTKSPVENVRVAGELEIDIDTESDEDELILKAKGETNGDGFAILDFKIPEDVKIDDDGDLKIVARKNGIVRELREDLDESDAKNSVFITVDKPMYQPGQSFNVRGLYLDANKTVISGGELQFSIKDGDDTTVYRETVKTSEFGIASVSWKIPDNAKLGDYRVEIENDDDDELGDQTFKISRYDLPNFAVTAKPDKTFYLLDDRTAEITVSADYLFGKPVTKGKVRVVQENDRRWNWKKQKYESDEKQTVEGATSADGKFVAKVDLSEGTENLKSQSWKRFEDLHFAAYYTDLTTNRTEQRRFDVRLTREAIHVYLVGNNYSRNRDLPFTAYVSTFYADGTPAICDVEIKSEEALLAKLKTNSLGGGKTEIEVPKNLSKNAYFYMSFAARDKNGQTGTFTENTYLRDEDAIKIETEKTIFKPGESVKINLTSTRKNGFVYLDIVKDRTVIESRFVKIENGAASVKVPYNPQFRGDLTIGVYNDETEGSYYYYDSSKMRASRGIIFPEQQNLKLDAKFSGATYKPGEDAKISFSIFDGAGKSIESALGIVVFDKAIEERARTDAEFGSYFSRYFGLLGYSKSFGGVTLKDLNDLDLSKNVSPEIQLAAEIMLAGNYYYPRIYHSGYDRTEPKSVYAEFFKKQLAPLEDALRKQYEKNFEHPTDDASLRNILSRNGIDFDDVRDPWGKNYRAAFTTEKARNIVTLITSGADKKFGSADDFIVSTSGFAYFTPTGQIADKAVRNYHQKTRKYVRDLETLSNALAEQDFDLRKLKDRWNRDYRIEFKVLGRNYQVVFRSLGVNGVYEPDYYNSDDFDIWTSNVDYFAETDVSINKIFSQNVNGGRRPFPKTDEEFRKILKDNDLNLSEIKDGFGESVYLTSEKRSRYANKTVIENGKQKITPVTEEVLTFYIKSHNRTKTDAGDDFILTAYSGVLSEQSKDTKYEVKEIKTVSYSGSSGAIRGTVTDQNGAFVPNAAVSATDENDNSKTFSAATNDEGIFLLENLPSGRYTIKIDSPGFLTSVYTSIQVRSQNLVEMTVTLSVGGAAEVVDVSNEAQFSVDASETKAQENLPINGRSFSSLLKLQPENSGKNQKELTAVEENSTPRLREYFPETLVWNPELITDKNGRAEMKFKMADNITTWKLYTVASTKNGKIGIAEKEVQAFQPFFVDLEPPKFLTDGDEIFLPTQVRNYTDKKQKVDVSMAKSDWFDFLSSEKQQLEVASNASENAVFGFKANGAIKNGKQKVTAIAAKDSDAIEKPVTVKPNGQEIVKTESKLFSGGANFEVNFPENALAKTPSAELKIYPNLFSHVSDSVEGLLQRPYGCGEQTISSTYPNLMILKFTKDDDKLRKTARNYLQKGYERLIGYQVSSGGFSYWGGKEQADIALTAYALRFLSDADGVIEVDDNIIERAQNWLIAQQRADGSFTKKYYYENSEDARRTKMFTSYIARALAMLKAKNGNVSQTAEIALQKSLGFLKTRNAEIDEPYALALFGIASFDSGNIADAKAIAEKLETMAIAENDSVYWNLETNTPFYGWGTPGRIETTALVLQLLIKTEDRTPKTEDLISRSTMFLLKSKDRYGVWYSTQTTVNVLDAFLASLSGEKNVASRQRTIQILLNGAQAKTFVVTPEMIAPLTFELKENLSSSANNLEIKSLENSPLMAQLVQTHYIDWRDAEISNRNTNDSRQIRLDYKCDNQTAAIMQEISCGVEAERIGFQGYGMLLAEIGIPPGADVSRESLEKALQDDWSLSRYDILPDRIVLYMWSKAGGTKFNFKFRPRYAVNAQTPASVIYDYYNDESRGIVAPLKFTVK